VRYEVLTAVRLSIIHLGCDAVQFGTHILRMCTTIFSDTLVTIYQTTLHSYPQDGGNSLPQNVDSYLPNFTVSRPRIQFRGTLEVVSLGSLTICGLVRCHHTEATSRRWSS